MKQPRNSAGLTLVELMVVIAIIGLLAAMLLPAVAAAQAKAKSIDCLAGLKNWGLWTTLYAVDEEALPRENGANRINRWPVVAAGTNSDVWYNAIPAASADRPASSYEPSVALRHEFHRRPSSFVCSAARFDERREVEQPHFSRAMNSRLQIGSQRSLLSAIADPSRTPLFLDAGVLGERPLAGQPIISHEGWPHVKWDRASARHGGFGNVGFADGSAAAVPSRELTNPAPLGRIHWEAR